MEQIKATAKIDGLKVDIDKQEFALALKTWRLRQGLLQREVAERWGMSRHTILRAENAKAITWTMAYRLFNKLNTELLREQSGNEVHDNY